MPVRRAIFAHAVSVLSASLILLVGLEFIVAGPVGVVQAIGKWIGGILIFLLIAFVSIPIGLVCRWTVGQLPVAPLTGALLGGASMSLALMFVLHPAMYPPMSFTSHPLSLALVHLATGMFAGWLWHLVEFGPQETLGD